MSSTASWLRSCGATTTRRAPRQPRPIRGRVPRLAQSWLGAVVEGVLTRTVADTAVVLDAISWPDPQAWYNAPAPERPFAEETRTPPQPLRIGLMAQAPLGIPTDP